MSYESVQVVRALPGTLADICATTHLRVEDVLYGLAVARRDGRRIRAIRNVGSPTVYVLDTASKGLA